METQLTFAFVENRWNDAVASQLDPLERLVYRSNLLGSDWRITNTGGGIGQANRTRPDQRRVGRSALG